MVTAWSFPRDQKGLRQIRRATGQHRRYGEVAVLDDAFARKLAARIDQSAPMSELWVLMGDARADYCGWPDLQVKYRADADDHNRGR